MNTKIITKWNKIKKILLKILYISLILIPVFIFFCLWNFFTKWNIKQQIKIENEITKTKENIDNLEKDVKQDEKQIKKA